jgi:Family of unknown function (DUF6492)
MSIDFLTVVSYNPAELENLCHQARRFAHFVDFEDVNTINVIINDELVTNESESWAKLLKTISYILPNYGPLIDKVQIVHRKELGYEPALHIDGWYTQQVCKILGTANSRSEWCLIFDSKTLLNRKFNINLLLDNNRGRFQTYKHIDPYWREGLKFVSKHYNVIDFKWIAPCGPPFLAHVSTMKDMVNRELDFVSWFHTYDILKTSNGSQVGVTEFLCYCAYLSSIPGLYSKLYTDKQLIETPTLHESNVKDFDSWMMYNKLSNPFTVALHPRAYQKLTDDQKIVWNQFLLNFDK